MVINKYHLSINNIRTNHYENRYYKLNKLDIDKLTKSINNNKLKIEVSHTLKRSTIENNIIYELLQMKRKDIACTLVSFMEEKAKFIPKNKVKDNNTNTKFAIDLYNNALDMADEIIILYKSLKPTYLANMHTKKRKTKTQTSDWKVLGKEIENKSINRIN